MVSTDDEPSTVTKNCIPTRRKRINFVRATTSDERLRPPHQPVTIGAGQRYLSIVSGPNTQGYLSSNEVIGIGVFDDAINGKGRANRQARGSICRTCKLPFLNEKAQLSEAASRTSNLQADSNVTASHEATIAHQACLPHLEPPSHIDRKRQGARYLSSYGWDPDTRQGLGANEDGTLEPIKYKIKNNTVGLGADSEQHGRRQHSGLELEAKAKGAEERRLHAGEMRRVAEDDRRRDAILKTLIWGDDKLERYLGHF